MEVIPHDLEVYQDLSAAEGEIERLKCEHLRTILILVCAAGGKITAHPSDMIKAPEFELHRHERLDTGCVIYSATPIARKGE